MWDEQQRERLSSLRVREAAGILTASERNELNSLYAALDASEQQALSNAQEQSQTRQVELQRENERLAHEVAELRRIRDDHQRLLAEARSYLHNLRAQRSELAHEYKRVTGRTLNNAP